MRREPVTGQVQYHNRTPWVSAMRVLHRVGSRALPGNLTEAETTVPQNQRLQCTQGAEPGQSWGGWPSQRILYLPITRTTEMTDRSLGYGFLLLGVRWLGMTGHFKCLLEGSILSSLDPWFYWSWTVWPLWLSIRQSGPRENNGEKYYTPSTKTFLDSEKTINQEGKG